MSIGYHMLSQLVLSNRTDKAAPAWVTGDAHDLETGSLCPFPPACCTQCRAVWARLQGYYELAPQKQSRWEAQLSLCCSLSLQLSCWWEWGEKLGKVRPQAKEEDTCQHEKWAKCAGQRPHELNDISCQVTAGKTKVCIHETVETCKVIVGLL